MDFEDVMDDAEFYVDAAHAYATAKKYEAFDRTVEKINNATQKKYYKSPYIKIEAPAYKKAKGLFSKKINAREMGISSRQAKKMQCQELISVLLNQGFNNILICSDESLVCDNPKKMGRVSDVIVDNKNSFRKTAKFSFDTPIIIKYVGREWIKLPMFPNLLSELDPRMAISKLKSKGFDNIREKVIYDLDNSLFCNDSPYIVSLRIDGKSYFERGVYYPPDVEIEIEYHDYRKNKY